MSYIKSKKKPAGGRVSLSRTSLSAGLMAGLMVTSLAQGQDTTAADESMVLPEVSIEAASESYYKNELAGTKFTAPVSRTPKTIQVIDQSIMRDQSATNLTEALRNSPGVGTFAMGETGSSLTGDAVQVRGVDASGSIFVDGVRDAGNVTHDLFNTEQVEIIKGADGSSFGRTSLNGTINMVSKRARLEDHIGSEITAGTGHEKRATMDINRQINDSTAFRLNLMGQNSGVPGRDHVKNRGWGIAPTLAFGLSTDKRLNISYEHAEQRNRPDGGVPGLGLSHSEPLPDPNAAGDVISHVSRPDRSNYYGTRSDFDRVKRDRFTVEFEADLTDNLTFHNTTAWARTHHKYMLSNINLSSLAITGNDWTAARTLNINDQRNTLLTNQAGFVQTLDAGAARHTLAYGLELSQEKVKTHGRVAEPDAPSTLNIYHPEVDYNSHYAAVKTGAGNKGRTNTISGYLFDTVELGDKWQFNGGIRLDRQHAKYTRNDYCDARNAPEACNGATGHDLATNKYRQNQTLFGWQLGGLYQINDLGNVYFQYAVAEEPNGNDGLVMEVKQSYANYPGYDPQKSKTAELGTKWKLFDERLLFSAALFHTDITNQVEQDEVSREYHQNGKKRVKGLELSAVGQITDNWEISAGYAYMKTRVVRGALVAEDGSEALPYAPKHAFTSWTTYRLPFDLVIGGGVRYVGSMTRDAKNTQGTPQKISGYWVGDLMARYPVTDNLALQLNVNNVADKKYIAAIDKKGYRYIPGMERSASLMVKLDF